MKKPAPQSLLSPLVTEYRQRSYDFWLSYIDDEPITLEIDADDGAAKCQVQINVLWDDKPDGEIRVTFSIDDGGERACLSVTESFIIAPDGTFVGD